MSINSKDVKLLGDYWVEGTVHGFHFQAKVYRNGSKFGIDDGRISKLVVWDKNYREANRGSEAIISYDRGWDKQPSTPEQEKILLALIDYFDKSH